MNNIDPSLIKELRSCSAEAEALRQLHPRQLKIIYEQKWFKLFVPKSFGGLELSLPEAIQLEESLASIDGSLGWTVTLCGGANWFIGFMSPELRDIAFNNSKVCLCGSGKPLGIAKTIGDEFEITGCWPYSTGAAHATGFTANCKIDGNDDHIRPFLFLPNEVTIIPDWKCMGMIATSSESFEVKNLRVNKNRMFHIDPSSVHIDAPVYRFPFVPFAEATLAVNCSGMALRFIELFGETNHNDRFQFDTARDLFFDAVNDTWTKFINNEPIDEREISVASHRLASASRDVVDWLYPYCGLRVADMTTEINRLYRDIQTASLHKLLVPLRF